MVRRSAPQKVDFLRRHQKIKGPARDCSTGRGVKLKQDLLTYLGRGVKNKLAGKSD